ncbi:MAG: hypothetical protein ACR2QW_09305 [bacterium]
MKTNTGKPSGTLIHFTTMTNLPNMQEVSHSTLICGQMFVLIDGMIWELERNPEFDYGEEEGTEEDFTGS